MRVGLKLGSALARTVEAHTGHVRGVHGGCGGGGGGGGVWLSQLGQKGTEEVAGPVADEEQHRPRWRCEVEQVRERAAVQRAREEEVPRLG